jgi:hypothetical protein
LRRDRRKKCEEEDWLIKNRKRKENIERFREQNDSLLLNIIIPLLLVLIVPLVLLLNKEEIKWCLCRPLLLVTVYY